MVLALDIMDTNEIHYIDYTIIHYYSQMKSTMYNHSKLRWCHGLASLLSLLLPPTPIYTLDSFRKIIETFQNQS